MGMSEEELVYGYKGLCEMFRGSTSLECTEKKIKEATG